MVERKIPKKEKVVEAIKKVVRTRIKVTSLQELTNLVLKELRRKNRLYSITSNRIKKLILEIPEIEIKAKTKRTPSEKIPENCPICGSKLEPIKIKNLANQWITIGYKCTKCGYKASLESFGLFEYEFVWKRNSEKGHLH
ncbi:MAG: hypothetical protein B6U78_01085 [Candidatus Aenigmarchaeota archaeon ex4484_224]|nr:MAG: hypothetical protein B6U78_01085 [Candidatus Aenigmarchaeota archaeon ex4484_224]